MINNYVFISEFYNCVIINYDPNTILSDTRV